MKVENWKHGAIRAFFVYSLNMIAAIRGWVYGFGLTVHNYWALIGIMLLPARAEGLGADHSCVAGSRF